MRASRFTGPRSLPTASAKPMIRGRYASWDPISTRRTAGSASARMESLLRYCMEQTDGQGFIYGREGDWIYIDWAELDKEGTLCAEQLLLARSYEAVASVRRVCIWCISYFMYVS